MCPSVPTGHFYKEEAYTFYLWGLGLPVTIPCHFILLGVAGVTSPDGLSQAVLLLFRDFFSLVVILLKNDLSWVEEPAV